MQPLLYRITALVNHSEGRRLRSRDMWTARHTCRSSHHIPIMHQTIRIRHRVRHRMPPLSLVTRITPEVMLPTIWQTSTAHPAHTAHTMTNSLISNNSTNTVAIQVRMPNPLRTRSEGLQQALCMGTKRVGSIQAMQQLPEAPDLPKKPAFRRTLTR